MFNYVDFTDYINQFGYMIYMVHYNIFCYSKSLIQSYSTCLYEKILFSTILAVTMSGEQEKSYCFKIENKFVVKSGCKKRMWRSLKQILTAERALPWPNDSILYYSINAPPTFKPTKKYSDISGLPAPYIDRHSKLYYSNAEEFATVRSLPMDITAGYLQLRGASTLVG